MGGVVCTTLISSDLPTFDAERRGAEARRVNARLEFRIGSVPAVASSGMFGTPSYRGAMAPISERSPTPQRANSHGHSAYSIPAS